MKLPTYEQSLELLKKYDVLPNVLAHLQTVNKVANHVAARLKEAGIKIDIDVVDRAAILHDIAKSITIRKKIHDVHHILAEEILTKEGYPELGLVCRRHSLREMDNIHSWEEKVVKYADLCVKHEELVTIKDRLKDINVRYNLPNVERVDEKKIFALEKEIMDAIHETPESFFEKLKKAVK